jgi:hypothetical protein
MKTEKIMGIIVLIALVGILSVLLMIPTQKPKECTLSLCDCKCYEKGQSPEEKTGKLCGINCLGEFGVSGCKLENNECTPIVEKQCETDADCISATCCHPTSCVQKYQRVCNELCTMECRPNTMDCGQGHCGCVNGQCQVVWANQ